ncbi:hypothetical protein ACP70R_000199 [Stipagrostis hirtigluma subsp. patula]
MDFFGSNIPYCQAGDVSSYIYNITSPYTDDTTRSSVVGTSVAMFALTALFFSLTMFRRISPSIRLARSAALTLFLPVMSYLFSEAKSAAGETLSNAVIAEVSPLELPMRARLILSWMLLVELLRKKTEALSGSAGTAETAARIAWLGSLVFSSIRNPGRRAVFAVLWTVAAAKMVQRLVTTEVIRRSFAAGRNPEIIGAYTRQVLQRPASAVSSHGHGLPPMASCEFAVMGEENIKRKTGPHGYVVVTPDTNVGGVVTVGKIWRATADARLDSAKRLCLSFALYKLLRRRLEDPRSRYVVDEEMETRACRELIFFNDGGGDNPEEVFRVVADEINLLSSYYHSAIPVVLSSPFFFLANYILFPVAVGGVCLLAIIAGGDGLVLETFRSIRSDNSVISFGLARTAVCLLRKVLSSPPALLSAVDLVITVFLFAAYLFEEACEFVVFLHSDWFVVSLVCSYVQDGRRRCRRAMASAIHCVMTVGRRFIVRRRTLPLKQLDVMRTACQLPVALLRAVPVPPQAKVAVVEYIGRCARRGGAGTLSNGRDAVAAAGRDARLSWACESESVARVILTWHVATALFDARRPPRKGAVHGGGGGRGTATALSRYCAYLVAFRPELLPDDWNETRHVYDATVREMKEALGWWGYYLSPERVRLEKLAEVAAGAGAGGGTDTDSVLRNGAALGKALMEEVEREGSSEEDVWKVLAELWVELVVYVAPASDGAHVGGHCSTLVEGGEFVTLLWALATHTGVTRPTFASTAGGGAAFSAAEST